MAKTGFPSLTALLGLLAVAGYQNRDKLGEWFGQGASQGSGAANGMGGGQGAATAGTSAPPSLDRILGGMTGAPGAAMGLSGTGMGIGGMIASGIGELMERFRGTGHGETAQSWVNHGPNAPIEASELESALGPELLDDLTQRTGLSRQELLDRLSRQLPDAIDRYTPEGRY